MIEDNRKAVINKWSTKFAPQMKMMFPPASQVLRMGLQGENFCIWTVNVENPTLVEIELRCVPTGVEPPESSIHVTTLFEGEFVWHVFQIVKIVMALDEAQNDDMPVANVRPV